MLGSLFLSPLLSGLLAAVAYLSASFVNRILDWPQCHVQVHSCHKLLLPFILMSLVKDTPISMEIVEVTLQALLTIINQD